MSFLLRLGFAALLLARSCVVDGNDDGDDVTAMDASVGGSDAGLTIPDAGHSSDAAVPISDAGVSMQCSVPGCDPREALGCDGGQCLLHGASPMCIAPLTVLRMEGQACTDVAECEAGLACFRRGGQGRCGRICCPSLGTSDTCESDQTCRPLTTLVDDTDTMWGHCVEIRSCDVFEPMNCASSDVGSDCCEPGEACYVINSSGGTDCRIEGSGVAGDSCSEQNDCASGFACTGFTDRHCEKICELGATTGPRACETAMTCVAQAYSPPGTGVCVDDT